MELMVLLFVPLLLFGMPVAFAMGLTGTVGVLSLGGVNHMIIPQRIFMAVDSFPLMAVPFFILAGELMNRGGITTRVVKLADVLVGHFYGGMANVNVTASLIMSGFSGSATADAVAVGSVMIPSMVKQGYPKGFSAGVTAASACIGPIMPPSIVMVLYGAITGISVGALFLAGIIPAILVAATQLALCNWYARRHNWPRSPRPSLAELGRTMKESFWALIAPIIIIGGIAAGVTTATEAGVAAAVYALVVGIFVYKELKIGELPQAFVRAAVNTAIPVIIISMANVFGWVLARERFSYGVTELITSISTNPTLVMLMVILMLLLVGLLVEGTAVLMIFVPVLFPIGMQFGLDPIHWAILIILTILLGTITPPVGLQLYVSANIAEIPVREVVIWPFAFTMLAVILLVAFFPNMAIYIPRLFGMGL